MPKIKTEEEEFEDEDEEEDNEDELEVEEEIKPKKPQKKVQAPSPARENLPKSMQPSPKRRFGIALPTNLQVIDIETKEIIGEGELAMLHVQTEILERLERIENTLGSMVQ